MKMQWNWGKSMAAVYILFVIGTLSFVGYALTQKVELVSDDYYAQEVAYQKRIDQMERTQALSETVDITIADNKAHITFPSAAIPNKGTIHFYHPAESSLDTIITIHDNSRNTITDISALTKGRWKVAVEWFSNNIGYYQESVITL